MGKTMTKTMAVMMVLLMSGLALGGSASVIMNDSFENDGEIDNITTSDYPQRWDDVNIPSGLFGGAVWSGWPSVDENSLTLYSYSWVTFDSCDMATISQQVYLDDVNHIYFSLKLDTDYGPDYWDESKRTAVLLIDDTEVWGSDELTPDVSGEYLVDVNEAAIAAFKDPNRHKLSLGLRVEEDGMPYFSYYAQWDYIRFDAHCGGIGYLPADFDQNCYVNMTDFVLLAAHWLEEGGWPKYDLTHDYYVDFLDLELFILDWLSNSFEYEQEDLLLEGDLNADGIINFIEYAETVKNWDGDYGLVRQLCQEWLKVDWLYWVD